VIDTVLQRLTEGFHGVVALVTHERVEILSSELCSTMVNHWRKYRMTGLLLIFTALCLSGTVADLDSYVVHHAGALKNIMHEGDVSSHASLSDLSELYHLYALGAVAGLKGEIQIFDGKPVISYVKNGELNYDDSFERDATLLVYAQVPDWQDIEIPESVQSQQDLEAFVMEAAADHDIDTNEPFPFLVAGKAKKIEWHVIDWKDGDTEHTRENHVNSGLNGKLDDTNVEILGFYSNKHHAVFTHHTTNIHMHFKNTNCMVAGHVDNVTLGENMTLRLPQTK